MKLYDEYKEYKDRSHYKWLEKYCGNGTIALYEQMLNFLQ